MSTEKKMAVGDLLRQMSAMYTILIEAETTAAKTGDKGLTDRVATIRAAVSKLHQEMLTKVGPSGRG